MAGRNHAHKDTPRTQSHRSSAHPFLASDSSIARNVLGLSAWTFQERTRLPVTVRLKLQLQRNRSSAFLRSGAADGEKLVPLAEASAAQVRRTAESRPRQTSTESDALRRTVDMMALRFRFRPSKEWSRPSKLASESVTHLTRETNVSRCSAQMGPRRWSSFSTLATFWNLGTSFGPVSVFFLLSGSTVGPRACFDFFRTCCAATIGSRWS